MTKCLNVGDLNANGPCTLFTDVNAHGLNLYQCSEFTFTPATCPDDSGEGTINAGAATAKIASVDGTVPDVCVQRDSGGIAYAIGFQSNGDCIPNNYGSRVWPDYVAAGPVAPLQEDEYGSVRVRGNGDIPSYGGLSASNTIGVHEIRRMGGSNGDVYNINVVPDITNTPATFRWQHLELTGSTTQDLMSLSRTAGTLYFPAWTYVSDIRLKDEVTELDGAAALEVVMGISPIAYTMRGQRYHGFSAQNVQTVLPQAVTEPATKEAPMTMRESDIVANLVAAVKYLTLRVQALEAKVGG